MLPKIPTNLGKSDTSSERGEHFKHRVYVNARSIAMLGTSQVCALDDGLTTKKLHKAIFEIVLRWPILLANESDDTWR